MPRTARMKTVDSIYHVMCRSISEVDLFREDEDKIKYMEIVKRYKDIHKFGVYCYCLMKNHVHFIIDAKGADISQIMHGMNLSYVHYFNKKYKRHGHLFQDRFRSKIIDNDRYLVAATAYIHNNPVKLKGYKKNPEKYEFSSLGTFLGMNADPFCLVYDNFVMSYFRRDSFVSSKQYYELVLRSNAIIEEEVEFADEKAKYVSYRTITVRNAEPDRIIEYLAKKNNVNAQLLYAKGCRSVSKTKALLILMLKSMCNYNTPMICEKIGNVTQSNVSRLLKIAVELIQSDLNARNIVEGFQ